MPQYGRLDPVGQRRVPHANVLTAVNHSDSGTVWKKAPIVLVLASGPGACITKSYVCVPFLLSRFSALGQWCTI